MSQNRIPIADDRRHTRMHPLKKAFALLALLSIAFTLAIATAQADPPSQAPPTTPVGDAAKIAPQVQQAIQTLPAGDMITVVVTLKEQANLASLAGQPEPNRASRLRNVITELRTRADASQRLLKVLLVTRRAEGFVSQVTYFWVFNGLAVTATPAVIQELAVRPEVLRITPDESFQAPAPITSQGQLSSQAMQPNLTLLNISTLWDLGYQGQGIVVANMDTGVDINHPDLGLKWRGGTNSWFDPYNQHPTTPTDLAGASSGHGTQTMGVMVGGQDGGTAFGIAPQAHWIAAKIFQDNGTATATAIHAAFQWLLDPDGNPATPDAPNVVNNSWTAALGCNESYRPDLQALRAAGILPIFAAGNSGPNTSTSTSPANYPEAFAVGAINNSNIIKLDSSRGTSACDGTIFPEVVAPGVGIHTTDRFGFYTNASGTSLAAPHVAGGLTLLLNAYPAMTVTEQETTLINSAVDLGPVVGPDNDYGQGRIDLLAALEPFSANLALSQAVTPANSAKVGTLMTYTLTITNSGPMTATAVSLSNELSPKVSFNSATPSQGGCGGPSGDIVICNLGELAVNGGATVELNVTLVDFGQASSLINVTSLNPDLNPDDNTATINVTALGQSIYLPAVLK